MHTSICSRSRTTTQGLRRKTTQPEAKEEILACCCGVLLTYYLPWCKAIDARREGGRDECPRDCRRVPVLSFLFFFCPLTLSAILYLYLLSPSHSMLLHARTRAYFAYWLAYQPFQTHTSYFTGGVHAPSVLSILWTIPTASSTLYSYCHRTATPSTQTRLPHPYCSASIGLLLQVLVEHPRRNHAAR